MFLKHLWFINKGIRTITSVIPTLGEKNFIKSKFIPHFFARPSEGWGWGADSPILVNVNKTLIEFLKFAYLLLNDKSKQSFNNEVAQW